MGRPPGPGAHLKYPGACRGSGAPDRTQVGSAHLERGWTRGTPRGFPGGGTGSGAGPGAPGTGPVPSDSTVGGGAPVPGIAFSYRKKHQVEWTLVRKPSRTRGHWGTPSGWRTPRAGPVPQLPQ